MTKTAMSVLTWASARFRAAERPRTVDDAELRATLQRREHSRRLVGRRVVDHEHVGVARSRLDECLLDSLADDPSAVAGADDGGDAAGVRH